MKTKIKLTKIDFAFEALGTIITIRWKLIGKKELNCINYKLWEVSAIVYNNGSGLLNVICPDEWETTLQPNVSNSTDYYYKIVENK
jgi:hypothetical protein